MGVPQNVVQLQPVAVGNEEHETGAMYGQVHWVICQQPFQYALLYAVVPDPAFTPWLSAQMM